MSRSRIERNIGEYHIVAELARGGMGRVYLARRSGQAGFERMFAIKVMMQHLSDDDDAVMMLLDEAHIASRMHHPNVVSVLDIGRSDDGYYLVMDYVEGCTLQHLLRSSPASRPPRLIVPILLEALRGLDAVHTLTTPNGEPYGVVHRDVSPHNLLLGRDGCCRVTDFGIAKAAERYTDTQAGVYKGKLAFMAPEQLLGNSPVDYRADIWAAGVTLYHALTGEHPFRRDNDGSTLHCVLNYEIPPPSQVGLMPPTCFDDVIMRSLERKPEERFPSAQAFHDALREVAIRADMLGSPKEVAQWVEEICGADLEKRRRQVAALHQDGETIGGSTHSLPQLWLSGETTSATGSAAAGGSRQTRSGPVVEARGSSLLGSLSPNPTKALRAAMIAGAVCLGAVVALAGSSEFDGELPAIGGAAPQPVMAAPQVLSPTAPAPNPALSQASIYDWEAEQAPAPEPTEPLIEAKSEAEPTEGAEEPETEKAHKRTKAPAVRPRFKPKTARAAPQRDEEVERRLARVKATVARVREETHTAPPVEAAPKAKPAKKSQVEANPYLFGE